MFKNYQNIDPNHIPDNSSCIRNRSMSYTKLCPVSSGKPYEEYDMKGNLIGYSWRYGETLNLEFNIDGEITVEDTALILTATGQTPSSEYGFIGQRAYNVVDLLSWTCTAITTSEHHWTLDKEFTYNTEATQSMYIPADTYLKHKTIIVTLRDFRYDEVFRASFDGKSKIVFPITPDLSKKLVKGIYYCEMFVVTDSSSIPVFTTADCTLLVK